MPLFHRSARSRSPSMPAIEKISSCVEERQQGKVSITSPPLIPYAVSLLVGYIYPYHTPYVNPALRSVLRLYTDVTPVQREDMS